MNRCSVKTVFYAAVINMRFHFHFALQPPFPTSLEHFKFSKRMLCLFAFWVGFDDYAIRNEFLIGD